MQPFLIKLSEVILKTAIAQVYQETYYGKLSNKHLKFDNDFPNLDWAD